MAHGASCTAVAMRSIKVPKQRTRWFSSTVVSRAAIDPGNKGQKKKKKKLPQNNKQQQKQDRVRGMVYAHQHKQSKSGLINRSIGIGAGGGGREVIKTKNGNAPRKIPTFGFCNLVSPATLSPPGNPCPAPRKPGLPLRPSRGTPYSRSYQR